MVEFEKSMKLTWLDFVILFFGAAILFGGVYGYLSSRSYVSLFSAVGADLLLTMGVVIATKNRTIGYLIVTLTTAALGTFFGIRLLDGQLIPAAPIVGLSVIVLACLAFGHFNKTERS